MLTVFRRHTADCEFFGKPRNARGSRHCKNRCPLWVQGSLGGEYVRKSLNLEAWEAAAGLVRAWEASGQIGVVRPQIPLREAVAKYVDDVYARGLSAESVKKLRDAVERLFLGFCAHHGCRLLTHVNVDDIREYRNYLVKKYAASSAQSRLEYVRGFLRFCQHSGWITTNPAAVVKPPRSKSAPTLPFEDEEVARMLEAAETFTSKGVFGAGNKQRVRAMLLLLRYSGLRISDAATLERARVKGTKVFLYTQKTGTAVWVPLPQFVVEALNGSPSHDPRYFFGTANVSGHRP